MTAYVGLARIGKPRPGETVFVSAAAGAVGSIASQIAKIEGCRVVASAGSPQKLRWLRDEINADAAIDYRTTGDLRAALTAACPNGLDVYFDNVGGAQLEAALHVANNHGRFVLCGMIGQYNDATSAPGPSNLFLAVTKRLTLKGFLIIDHDDVAPEFEQRMRAWIAEGKIRWRDTIVEGLDAAPQAFLGLFSGDNLGKMLVKLGDI